MLCKVDFDGYPSRFMGRVMGPSLWSHMSVPPMSTRDTPKIGGLHPSEVRQGGSDRGYINKQYYELYMKQFEILQAMFKC